MPVSMLIDKKTFAVVRMEADMAATLEAMYAELFSGLDLGDLGDVDLSVRVPRCSMLLEYANFNSVPEFEMPDAVAV